MSQYGEDLAWVHHVGYTAHARQTAPGLLRILRAAGIARGERVVDVGCGGGHLAAELLAAGFAVHGVDASESMIHLAQAHAPKGVFEVVALPTKIVPGTAGGLPRARAVVSCGHVLNYLESREDIRRGLIEMAQAVKQGGVLAFDLMTERYCTSRDLSQVHAQVQDDWTLIARFSRPEPHRFERMITIYRNVEGRWRRTDEHHRNISFEADEALDILHQCGIRAQVQDGFGDEHLPEGLVVIVGQAR